MEYKLALGPDKLWIISRTGQEADWQPDYKATEVIRPLSEYVLRPTAKMLSIQHGVFRRESEREKTRELFNAVTVELGMAGMHRLAYQLAIEYSIGIAIDRLTPVGFYTHYTADLDELDPVELWDTRYALIVIRHIGPLADMQEFNSKNNQEMLIDVDGIVGPYTQRIRKFLESWPSLLQASMFFTPQERRYIEHLKQCI